MLIGAIVGFILWCFLLRLALGPSNEKVVLHYPRIALLFIVLVGLGFSLGGAIQFVVQRLF